MFPLLMIFVFLWLGIKVVGLVIRITWGLTKLIASALLVIALPLLIVSLIFWSGVTLLLPIILLCIAFGILKACT